MTFWWPMWGKRLPKLPKLPNVSKNVPSSKCSKQHFQGLAHKVPVKECVRVLYQPDQVCSGPEALPSLVQPCPAFSSRLQPGQGLGALPTCPEAQGECLSFRELSREVTGPRSLDSIQGCAQEEHMAIFTSSP